MMDNSIPMFRIKEQVNSCFWYAAAKDQPLLMHPDQDRLDQGKIALEVPEQLVKSFSEKGIHKVYAPLDDLVTSETVNHNGG